HGATEARAVRPGAGRYGHCREQMTARWFRVSSSMEGKRSRWGGWPSKPERAVSRFLVGSTPTLFRQFSSEAVTFIRIRERDDSKPTRRLDRSRASRLCSRQAQRGGVEFTASEVEGP